MDLEKAIYGSSGSVEFTVKVALDIKEVCELVKVGFEYMSQASTGTAERSSENVND